MSLLGTCLTHYCLESEISHNRLLSGSRKVHTMTGTVQHYSTVSVIFQPSVVVCNPDVLVRRPCKGIFKCYAPKWILERGFVCVINDFKRYKF